MAKIKLLWTKYGNKLLSLALTGALMAANCTICGKWTAHATSVPEFSYFASKGDWSQAKLTNDSKAIKINLGTVPHTISGEIYDPTDTSLGLTAGDPLTWWVVGSNENEANLYSEKALCFAKFNESIHNKSYQTSWGCTYNGEIPNFVSANHYGGSDIRNNVMKTLHNHLFQGGMEVGLIADSTIKCWDLSAQKMYTVTDKMYLPTLRMDTDNMPNSYGKTMIYVSSSEDTTVGTNNQIPSKYWVKGISWLRSPKYNEWMHSPYYSHAYCSLRSDRGRNVVSGNVCSKHAVAAACKINISSLSFSSAAKSAADTAHQKGGENLTSYKGVHNLRLEDSVKLAADIQVNNDCSIIKAKLSTTPSEMYYLMVQGVGDNDTNYAYARKIESGSATIKASDITATGVSGFEDAKAWVEKAPAIDGSDGRILYASNLTIINANIPLSYQ